jgi:AhpC/TSA family/Thiol:disulfide interchange protein DsbD, N-terminal
LQQAHEQFRKEGLGLAAVSYDSLAILQDFTKRHNIDYPLLADPNSEIIRSFGVLNEQATGFSKGMALPGYFYITPDGLIKEKFFETAYTDRYTADNLLMKLFPQLVEGAGRAVASPHIKLNLLQSDQVVVPGSRFTLVAEVELPNDTHVYAPGVKGYKPIQLAVDAQPELKLEAPRYPESKILHLPAINESVPVFEGKFRIFEDVTVSADREFIRSIGAGKTVTVKGALLYQACDSVKCYLPQRTEVSWSAQVMPLDRERAPQAIQHK